MNSYNENLHTSIVTSLNEQELALKKAKASLDASMFSLYYAEGARITAAEKLEIANKNYVKKQQVYNQAIIDSDLSTNVLASANQGKTSVSTSTANTAVAAANTQIAANAILKLASDVGSIFSIVSAADFDSEIYQQSSDAYELMNTTAYLAELTSQHSMEASSLIAEVSASTLADKAKATDTSIKNILDEVTTDFDTASATVAADNTQLAAANTAEKKAEGTLEDINVSYYATLKAYQLNNSELNLNLTVTLPTNLGERTNYTVSFNPYTSPFTINDKKLPTGYPVNSYYIMLVKDSRKAIFSIADAEGLVAEDYAKRYIKINAQELPKPNSPITKQIYTSELWDTDGDEMQLGDSYVVFVFAVLDTEYKKILNTFDDFLSAASASFILTNMLTPPEGKDITVSTGTGKNKQELSFSVTESLKGPIEYRCLFLPDYTPLIHGLLTETELRSIENEAELLEEIADKYDPIIASLETQINSLRSENSGLDEQLVVNKEAQSQDGISESDLAKLTAQAKNLTKQRKDAQAKIKKLEQKLKKEEKDRTKAINSINPAKNNKPGFFFNLLIAEQVSAGNYIVASETNAKDGKSSDLKSYSATIEPETTDNFGNRLIDENTYIPVILAFYNDDDAADLQFTNALSDFQNGKNSFTYVEQVLNQ